MAIILFYVRKLNMKSEVCMTRLTHMKVFFRWLKETKEQARKKNDLAVGDSLLF
jgi:hypothetical protein